MCGCRRPVVWVWVSKAFRVCGYRRLVGCGRLVVWVWVSKAYRVCGCRRLIGCVGVEGL